MSIKYFLILFLFLLTENSCTKKYNFSGKWCGEAECAQVCMFFNKSDIVKFSIFHTEQGQEKETYKFFKYKIDYSKDPVWFDLIPLYTNDDSQRTKGIIKFISDTQFKLRIGFNNPKIRFNNFDIKDKETTIVFKKEIQN